jgi:SAM-dependent methyltransferase
VAGVDPIPGMLSVAARLGPGIEWREGRAESLPFESGSFDVVVSQFGMMFFADRVLAAREMSRVLVKRGRFAVAVWDALDRSPGYAAEVTLLQRMVGQQAADALRAPFVLADSTAVAAGFREAGFDPVEVTTQQGTADFPSVRAMVEADLRGWLPVMNVHLSEADIARVLAEAEEALRPFVTEGGRVRFAAPAHIVHGRKP